MSKLNKVQNTAEPNTTRRPHSLKVLPDGHPNRERLNRYTDKPANIHVHQRSIAEYLGRASSW